MAAATRPRLIAESFGTTLAVIDLVWLAWVMTVRSPKEQIFSGRTLEEGLAWCLVWLMAPEIGVGPFRT